MTGRVEESGEDGSRRGGGQQARGVFGHCVQGQEEEGKWSEKCWREREFCEKWTVAKWCWLEEVKRRMTLRCSSGRRTSQKERSWSRKGIERGNEEVGSGGSSE
jgi:hypothetical protein